MYLPGPTPGTSPRLAPLILVALLAGLGTATPAGAREFGADQGGYTEEEIKAAFLFHFATYAEWPSDERHDEITFALLGASSVASELERFAEGRTIQGRPVNVRRIESLSALNRAEVLFIGASQNDHLGELIEQVEGSTLVVTDVAERLPDGAMINFQLVGQRIQFEIALPAVQRVGLTLSSRLLSAAYRVEMSRATWSAERSSRTAAASRSPPGRL